MRTRTLTSLVLCLVVATCANTLASRAHAADSAKKETISTKAAPKNPPRISPLATEGPKPAPIPPPKPEKITAAIKRGVKFLLAAQRKDGSWGGPEKTKG